MADIARTAIVSNENHNGLLVDDSTKNSPSGDSNELTECSASNTTNNCSNNNSCSSAIDPKESYQEIDSFSELSFRTTDEISLQDLIESEFAARISNINGDEFGAKSIEDCWTSSELNKSRDPFDDLFEGYKEKESEKKMGEMNVNPSFENKETCNLDEFISGAMQGDTSLITDYTEEEPTLDEEGPTYEHNVKSMNIFKSDRPNEIPILTNFDPFTAIEEDSDCSNPLPESNMLNSPDEFPFPDSPVEAARTIKEREKADEYPGREYIESVDDDENDNVNKAEANVMRQFFTKTISDDNLDSFVEVDRDENGDLSKFHVVNNMSSVESVNNSFPNTSNLTSPEKNELDEFFSSEDIIRENERPSDRVGPIERSSYDDDVKEIAPPGKVELFIDDEAFDEFQDFSNGDDSIKEKEIVNRKFSQNVEEWTTVEEALKAQPEDFELDGDSSALNVTNNELVVLKTISINGNSIKDRLGLTNKQINGLSESESETETRSESSSSEKKTTKKRKSKKGKKSDEKENISVEPASQRNGNPLGATSAIGLEHLEDLSNVSVKNLMQTYSSDQNKPLHNRWFNKEPGSLPVQNLKARSMVDLTSNSKKVAVLLSNLFENSKNVETSRSTTNLSNLERHPVVTGVSVRALKSSFNKFDQLSKKTILHVRSVDTTKVQKQFNEAATGGSEITSNCRSCGKQVFQMEQIKAEKSVWHKNCFRCKECNKQLSVDTYSSHEGVVYCKPHFRELFKPKAVLEDETEPVRLKKPELIIRENQPVELPPEVVRASDKPDLGLEELAALNVKSRYQVFEKGEETTNLLDKSPSSISVKRSPSILCKLAKFQKKGMDVGVRDDELNGLPIEQSSTSSEEEEEEQNEEEVSSKKIIKSKKVRERPMSFSKMGDVKSAWESGVPKTREEMREERNKEIHQIRSKLFMGKQVKMKEAYEQAVRESESMSPRKSVEVRSEKAKSIKECFEKGEPLNVDDENEGGEEKKKAVENDMSVFEAGISKKSRSLFLELDKSAKTQQAAPIKKPSPKSPTTPRSREPNPSFGNGKLVTSKCKALMKIFMYPRDDRPENHFTKMCTYQGIGLWTERRHLSKTKIGFYCKVSRQPSDNVVKCSDAIEDVQIETADISSKFKFFETYKEPEREKKKFRITPPREDQIKTESPEKEIYRDPNVVRACDKVEQEIIRTNTTTKMLSLFRQMEEKTEEIPEGPKPLKRFTPPPDYKEESEGESDEDESEEEEEEEETNPNIIRSSDKVEDEYLKQAASAARAKQLKAKFEKWEEKEKEREREEIKLNGSVKEAITENSENIEVTSIECTKSLRARFESMKSEVGHPKEKITRPKINRFVEIQNNMAELCDVCRGRVYQLEKVETSGKIFHKTCFRCLQCNCLLRMESFTLNCGNLYCLPHFKQKFISKGNYDEGFGVDQHKAKWPTVSTF